MSDSHAFGFGQYVPGFDFLQKLTQSASQAQPATGAMPGMASWVAPTLSIEEIDKRIQELKAVQFWLDQNATALKATIQAMEVQKMTLTTLQSMNVNMSDLAKAFTAKAPESDKASAQAPSAPKPVPQPAPNVAPQAAQTSAEDAASSVTPGQEPAADATVQSAVDPMQWWNALTQQFQAIASTALKDVAAEAMKADMSTQEEGAKPTAPGKRKSAAPRSKEPVAKSSAATKPTKSNAQSAGQATAKKATRKTTAS